MFHRLCNSPVTRCETIGEFLNGFDCFVGEGKGSTFTLVSHFLKYQYNQWVKILMSLSGSDQC